MSLSEEGREKWKKKFREDGLHNVRIKLSQGDYEKEGSFVQSLAQTWIKNEETGIAEKANKIAKWALVISVISLLVAVFK